MATLYTQKYSNIRKTWLIFTLFFIFIIGVGWLFSRAYGDFRILYIAVFFSVFMNILSYWFSDKIVLRMANAKRIEKQNAPELYNIVENLTITAGLAMPKIYIINDMAPNAFATGRNPKHAVVAVTEGLLRKLDRSELEGVIAHELSHIGNRDMFLQTIIVVLVGFIAILSDMFTRSAIFGGFKGRDNHDSRASGIIFLISLAAAILAPIAASLMQLAISRKREFLADASGALLTRYPEGLANALEKIAADPKPLAAARNVTAHLYIENPFKSDSGKKTSWLVKLFSTHPPVEERIRALKGMKV